MLRTSEKFKLSHYIWQKRFFDPKNKEDLEEYKYFIENSKWRTNCPFVLEWPYLTITDMIKDVLIEAYIGDMLKASNDREQKSK